MLCYSKNARNALGKTWFSDNTTRMESVNMHTRSTVNFRRDRNGIRIESIMRAKSEIYIHDNVHTLGPLISHNELKEQSVNIND